ncbi:hypothetical protein V6Z93_002765 [Aspergillus fumigatus]
MSTIRDLISAKHITTGARSPQCFGQMSDETLQQLSRNHKLVLLEEKKLSLTVSMDSMRSTGLGISLTIRKIRERVPPVVEVDHFRRAIRHSCLSFASVDLFQLFWKYYPRSLFALGVCRNFFHEFK